MTKTTKPVAKKTAPMVAVNKAAQRPTHTTRAAIRRAVKAVAEKFERAHA
jgi:hypothetical protein